MKEKKCRIKLIIWSSVRSPGNPGSRFGGGTCRCTSGCKKQRRKSSRTFCPASPSGSVCKAVMVEDVKKSCREQVKVSTSMVVRLEVKLRTGVRDTSERTLG